MVTRWRKRPVEVEAHRWWRNGDHPGDEVGHITELTNGWRSTRVEGRIVRLFRQPGYASADIHDACGHTWHDHGWVDTLEGGHVVCPGDWIITGVRGEHYPCKPEIFAETYEPSGGDE